MHVIHGELRKAPYVKQGVGKDGQSTMYIVELSEVIKDYKTKEKSYTNYSAMLFASSPAHIDHYNKTLVDGNFIVLTSEKLKIDVSECGKYIKLEMDNARLEGSGYIAHGGQQSQAPQQAQQRPQQNQGYQQPQQGQPAPMAEPDFDFDDDIPF